VILLGLALVFAFDDQTLFTAWKAQYNKQYSTVEEEASRFETFKLSVDRVQARNSKSGSATFGLTKYADLTPEEFKSTYLGYIRPAERSDVGVLSPKDVDVPQTLDWRTQNMVTPVKKSTTMWKLLGFLCNREH
jgi:hypothetical protein